MKPILRLLILTLLGGGPVLIGAGAVPCAMEEQYFQVAGDPQWYRSIAIRPLMPEDIPDKAAPYWLERYVTTITKDARDRGYLNANTRPHYEWEWEQLEQCRWPTVLITESQKSEILGGVSYAIRWHRADRMPFQRRFHIPLEFTPVFENRMVHLPERWVSPEFREQPASLFSMLPAVLQQPIVGEAAEVKHLYLAGKHPLQFLWQLHRHSNETELYRHSRIAAPGWDVMVSQLDPWSYETGLRLQVNLLPEGSFTDFLEFAYFRTDFQPFVRVGTVYMHVSDNQFADPGGPTKLARLYQSILGIPSDPMLRFLERPEWGTEGVLTEIYQMTDENYSTRVRSQIALRMGHRKSGLVKLAPADKCPKVLMSVFEASAKGWIDRDRARTQDAPRYFLRPFHLSEREMAEKFLEALPE